MSPFPRIGFINFLQRYLSIEVGTRRCFAKKYSYSILVNERTLLEISAKFLKNNCEKVLSCNFTRMGSFASIYKGIYEISRMSITMNTLSDFFRVCIKFFGRFQKQGKEKKTDQRVF